MALLTLGDNRALDQNGQPVPYAKRFVYKAGSEELSVLFKEQHLTEMTENPAAADENGIFQNCFLHAGQYRIVIVNARGKPVREDDDIVVTEAEMGFVRRFTTVGDMLSDTNLSYTAQRAKLRVSVGQVLDVAEGNFSYRILASDDASAHVTTAGGIKLSLLSGADSINIVAFGAIGDGIADNTTALQTAINAASRNKNYTVYIPNGHFRYDTIRLFYHATLNPGFSQVSNPSRQGRFRFVGQGSLEIAEVRNYSPTYGTILESTGDGLIVSSIDLGHGVNPYPARKFEAENITFVANKANKYVIEAASCPLIYLQNCVIYQRHINGHGIYLRSAWYADFERTRIFGVPGSTGTGIVAGTDVFGGLYTLRNSQLDTWRDGFDWQTGSFSNVSFRDTSIQSCTRNGIRGSGGALHHCYLDNVYFEGDSRECDIRGIGASIKNLHINQMFVLAGAAGGASYITDRIINLDETTGIEISGIYASRLTRPLCTITAVDNSGVVSGRVSHISISNDFTYTGATVFLFSGILPVFGEGLVWPGYQLGYRDPAATIRLFDPAVAYPNALTDRRTGTTSLSSLALGDVARFLNQTTTLVISALEKRSLIEVGVTVGGGVSLRLPNQSYVLGGRMFLVRCITGSTGPLTVQNNSDTSLVVTLRTGQSCIVVLDATTGKYIPLLADEITPQSNLTSLTNSTGGTVGAVLNAVTGSGADPVINQNFASLATQVDSILTRLRSSGLLV